MNGTLKRIIYVSLIITLIIGIDSGFSSAQTKREMREQRRKEITVKKREVYKKVIVSKRSYYYREGSFYEIRDKKYVVVSAPAGARIAVLPAGYKIIRHGRIRYYLYNGIYYRYLPRTKVYVVVKNPY